MTLIIGPDNRKGAESLVAALQADPTRVLYDEERAVYSAYSLERVFLSLIQQSAALVIDKRGIVQMALVATNPLEWLNPQQLKQIIAALDKLDRNPESASTVGD